MDTNIENDDLTCPITLELLRDPVLANDGRIYEREAIIKWISENGTSPFTRQPLCIEDLQPNDHLRHLAARRRNSTVSYSVRDGMVTLPPLRRMSRINAYVAPSLTIPVVRNRPLNQSSSLCIRFTICAVYTIVSVGLFIGLSVGLSVGTTSSPYNGGSGGRCKAIGIDSSMFETRVNDIFLTIFCFGGRMSHCPQKSIHCLCTNYTNRRELQFYKICMF
jgi:hypothetical protein